MRRLYWFVCAEIGFDARRFIRFFLGMPRYLRDLSRFRKIYPGKVSIHPCVQDWHEEGGSAGGEYFLQDLYVAQQVFRAAPEKHVDIGSRINGFAAHVASFREIEVFDIRPVTSTVPGIVFRQADLMSAERVSENYCDSLSSLHALEHFGLGRYGDPLDVQGHIRGLGNMARLLKPGGILYLSSPVGKARIEFNAQRILDPREVIRCAEENGLLLKSIASVHPDCPLQEADDPEREIAILEKMRYALGIFVFVKQ